MWLICIVSIFLICSLAGCATATKERGNLNAQQLRTRISEMETEIQHRDEEISALEAELERIKVETGQAQSEVSSEDVRQTRKNIQTALKNSGFYTGEIDGKIGKKTKQAIEEFQKANNLKVDGIVGLETWTKLKAHLN